MVIFCLGQCLERLKHGREVFQPAVHCIVLLFLKRMIRRHIMGLTMVWAKRGDKLQGWWAETQAQDDTAEASLLSQILHASKCVLVHSFVLTMWWWSLVIPQEHSWAKIAAISGLYSIATIWSLLPTYYCHPGPASASVVKLFWTQFKKRFKGDCWDQKIGLFSARPSFKR